MSSGKSSLEPLGDAFYGWLAACMVYLRWASLPHGGICGNGRPVFGLLAPLALPPAIILGVIFSVILRFLFRTPLKRGPAAALTLLAMVLSQVVLMFVFPGKATVRETILQFYLNEDLGFHAAAVAAAAGIVVARAIQGVGNRVEEQEAPAQQFEKKGDPGATLPPTPVSSQGS